MEEIKVPLKGRVLTRGFHVLEPIVTADGSGKLIVVKEVGHADKDRLNQTMARQLAADVKEYYQILKQAGINLPEEIEIEVIHIDGDRWGIAERAAFRGIDLEKLILQGSVEDCCLMVAGILENMKKVWLSGRLDVYDVEVTVDPKPANWVWAEPTGVTYVDFTPPRFRNGNGQILVEFPRFTPLSPEDWQFIYDRYFDRRGLIRILFVQLCRLRPELSGMFREMIREFLFSIDDQLVLEFFDCLRSSQIRQFMAEKRFDEVLSLIDGLSVESADDFRDIALELTRQKSELLAKVFELSHVDMSGRLTYEKTESLKEALKQMLNHQDGAL